MILLVVLFTLNMKSIIACVHLVKPKDILVVDLLVSLIPMGYAYG